MIINRIIPDCSMPGMICRFRRSNLFPVSINAIVPGIETATEPGPGPFFVKKDTTCFPALKLCQKALLTKCFQKVPGRVFMNRGYHDRSFANLFFDNDIGVVGLPYAFPLMGSECAVAFNARCIVIIDDPAGV
jgi:hypothetical protein